MTLERLHIQNFKGTRELDIDFGPVTRIYGMNASGKTSIQDAFCWVLWNKDSHGNTPGTPAFREKPLDEDGNEIHNLDITVELFCRLDGQPFNLRRTQRENWVQKRGAAEASFQGNVSTYWINDVETKLTDFKARIAKIVSEDVFRLIGQISAFNNLDWKKRREQLIAISGTDVDGLLLQRDEYRPIADEIAERGVEVEDLRKILTDQRRMINKDLEMFPVRIDEAKKALPIFEKGEIANAEYIVKDNEASIQTVDRLIAEAKAADGKAGIQAQILALETEANALKRIITDAFHAGKRSAENEFIDAEGALRRALNDKDWIKRTQESRRAQHATATAERDRLRADYTKEFERKFTPPEVDGTCPTCKQELPAEMVQAAVDLAKEVFEKAKKNTIASIKQDGASKAAEVTRLTDLIAAGELEEAAADERIKTAMEERDAAKAKLDALPKEPDYETEPRIAELTERIETIKAEQDKAPEEKVKQLEERKAELNVTLEKMRAVLARRDAGKRTQERISQLEGQQKASAVRMSEIEQLIRMVEEFIQHRCHALEESINFRFPTTRWKLFETQINGGITDVCQAYIPCESGLVSYDGANTAAKINCDIEIVNVLTEYYGVSIPLFADGAESVNVLAHTDSQLITLSVSTDETLKIVKEG